jgi:hypothetical protein
VVVLIRRVFWCVRSWDDFWLVHRSMKDDSKVANELYLKRGCLTSEDFLFFSLYSYSCIPSNSTTLEKILTPVSVLVSRYAPWVQTSNIHITCAQPCPLQYGLFNSLEMQFGTTNAAADFQGYINDTV